MFGLLIQFLKSRKMLPTISDTEREALEAGTVWVEGDLFGGRPDFRKFLAEVYPTLTAEERAFLEGPATEVCNMVRPWDLVPTGELPEEVWAFLKEHRFFGLLLPEEYEGHGFGSLAFSAIIGLLGTHSFPLNSVVLIPNSIGPGELIAHYGTPEQKERWLPPLARGDEIPAFALTEPRAGSDAGSLTSRGELFEEDGVLKIRLDWDKRYITLAPISTLLGLAFRLYDPQNLLGKGEDVGITCGLVPTDLPGVECGKRHDPLGTAFMNGPTRGQGVVVPADHIIGGVEHAGRGWKMLMEALAGGRALSLPSGAAYASKGAARRVGAYAALRAQFGIPIGKMEGVQEPLARIAGRTYLMDAGRIWVCGAVGRGQKPAVVSAIVKYQLTELGRQVANDSMDVLGGKAICRGPRNPIAEGYLAAPVAITVEGANILTRTLIVFGQGALRCHPYLQREIKALEDEDPAALRRAMFGHMFFTLGNLVRAEFHGATRGLFASAGGLSGRPARYARKIKWASAVYSVLADLVLVTTGPKLKQKGMLSGRFADALSWLYLGTATLRRYEAEGRQQEDLPLVDWSLQTALTEVQESLEGIVRNFSAPLIGWPVRFFGGLWLRLNRLASPPSDRLNQKVAATLLVPGAQRDRLTEGVFTPADASDPIAILEEAFVLRHRANPIIKRIRAAAKEGKIERRRLALQIDDAAAAGVVTAEEAELLRHLEALRDEVLAVDEFDPERFEGLSAPAPLAERIGEPVA